MNAKELINFLEGRPDADVSVAFIKGKANQDGSCSEKIRIIPVTSVRYNPSWATFEIVGVEGELLELEVEE